MDKTQFQQILRTKGSYSTDIDGDNRSVIDRLFGWSNLVYYINVWRTIYSGHLYAQRGEMVPETWGDHSYRVVRTVEACGGKLHISGMKPIHDINGPVVYVSNHMSLLETLLLPVILLQFNYPAIVVKKSLTTYPIFGDMMRAVEPIALDRLNPREDLKKVLTEGKENLSAGRSVLIFPQSTRSASIDPKKFNSLGVKLASRAGVPIVPLAVKTDFHGKGKLIKDMGKIDRKKHIYLKFGAPIKTEKNSKEVHEQTISFITKNLLKWTVKKEKHNDTRPTIKPALR
ncbi:MAG: 1-acyl-sn-glycerol-3-phosphate acyltransferase [Kiritimatiellae bacterium]|nr:1-acyl-sn-glycerol-3-phosphate acyltransferase [Kiritimatiellia bacterium]